MKKFFSVIMVCLAFLGILLQITQVEAYQETLIEIEGEKYLSISAISLINLYDQNEINADDMFLKKKIHVFGFIKDIGKDFSGNMYVTLIGGYEGLREPDSFRTVQCFFESEQLNYLKSLKKREPLEIIGTCTGLMMNVLIKDCQPGHWLKEKVAAEKALKSEQKKQSAKKKKK